MKIRYQVDAHDEQHLFKNESPDLNADLSVIHSHVRLGSLDKIMHLGSYAKKLGKDIHLQDLQELLAAFLRLNRVLDAKHDQISRFKVCMTSVCWQSIHVYVAGGPLSCIKGHVRLSGDCDEESGPPSHHGFLAWIGGQIRLCYSTRIRTVGVSFLPGVCDIYDINSR